MKKEASGMNCMNTRGAAAAATSGGSAAVVVVILTALVILYVLFLPPDIRNDLLNEGSTGGTGGSSGSDSVPRQTTLLKESVGHLNYLGFDDRTHDLTSFTIYSTTEAKAIKTVASAYVKNSWLDKKETNITFSVDKSLTTNVKLAFTVGAHDGMLVIKVNGHEIHHSAINEQSPSPISIPSELLSDASEDNVLTFSASPTGWAFWRSHEYELQQIAIIADVTDISKSAAEQHFSITDTEIEHFEKATLWFYPDCKQSTVGQLDIVLNDARIYRAIADCGILNHVEVDSADVLAGDNTIIFTVSEGRYLIDQAKLKVELENITYPVYYFDLDEDLFGAQRTRGLCGESDGFCPANCGEDRDIDCCFEENTYWCPTTTRNTNDRCLAYVYEADCSTCAAGYVNKRGNPPGACEERCGDDTDDYCPAGCSVYHDKDCCYADNEDNYWCDHVPLTGLSRTCTASVSANECADCTTGYEDESGDSPTCNSNNRETEEVFDTDYDINLTLTFPNKQVKKLDILVNGREIGVDTNMLTYSRIIDAYVRSGTNSIELVPRSDVDIASMTVRLKERN